MTSSARASRRFIPTPSSSVRAAADGGEPGGPPLVLFGAQAVTVHGAPRSSADVDVTLALTPDEPHRFATEMQAAGFSLAVNDSDFIRRTRVMPFIHMATGMPLDVVLARSGLEDEFLDRAKPTDLGGTRVPLIEQGDLVIAKILPARPKDLEDVRALWRIHAGRLDTERIRSVLRPLEKR